MAAQTGESQPVLWQIEISHYSEKVRWALEHKGIGHRRRSPLPGMHIPIALWLTGGEQKTLPILELDGRTIGDSTAAIAALEERQPEPPLYPSDPDERRRALELEDFFDEQLGAYTRVLPFHDLLGEPELFAELAAQSVPGPLGQAKGLIGFYARNYTRLRWGAGSDSAAVEAREKIVAAFDRLEAELDANGGGYLVGERFSVADLTAASMFGPLVGPEEGPVATSQQMPRAYEEFRDSQSERLGFRWVEDTFRKHRRGVGPPSTPANL